MRSMFMFLRLDRENKFFCQSMHAEGLELGERVRVTEERRGRGLWLGQL